MPTARPTAMMIAQPVPVGTSHKRASSSMVQASIFDGTLCSAIHTGIEKTPWMRPSMMNAPSRDPKPAYVGPVW